LLEHHCAKFLKKKGYFPLTFIQGTGEAQSVQRPGYRQGLIPSGGSEGIFSLCHCTQTNAGAHPTYYPMGTRASFPGHKVAGA